MADDGRWGPRRVSIGQCGHSGPVSGGRQRLDRRVTARGHVAAANSRAGYAQNIGGSPMDDAFWCGGSEADWDDLLNRYWRLVKPNREAIERELDILDWRSIQRLTSAQFYEWLYGRYFVWKFTADNRLGSTRGQLVRHQMEDPGFSELGQIQTALFAFDREDIPQGLEIATRIHGLGPAGGSGLLAVLFPEKFGTVDQFVVDALAGVECLPERAAILRMHRKLFPKPYGSRKSSGSLTLTEAAVLIAILRRKGADLNARFGSTKWTPRRVDMALWADRR